MKMPSVGTLRAAVTVVVAACIPVVVGVWAVARYMGDYMDYRDLVIVINAIGLPLVWLVLNDGDE